MALWCFRRIRMTDFSFCDFAGYQQMDILSAYDENINSFWQCLKRKEEGNQNKRIQVSKNQFWNL